MRVTYSVEVISQELLQAVLAGKVSSEDILGLKARMGKKRKKHSIILAVCALVLGGTAILTQFANSLNLSDVVMLSVLGCVFLAFIVGVFQANGLFIASKYLGAIKKGYPNV